MKITLNGRSVNVGEEISYEQIVAMVYGDEAVPIIASAIFVLILGLYFLAEHKDHDELDEGLETQEIQPVQAGTQEIAGWSGLSLSQVEEVLSYDGGYDRLVVSGEGFLTWASTGERFVIVEANSPENRLRYLTHDFAGNRITPDAALERLRRLKEMGVNTVYLTIFGGDDRLIYLSPENFELYRTYCLLAADLGMVCHVVLGEQENHHELSTFEREQLFTRAILMVYGTPSILLLGEEITQRVGYGFVRTWCEFLRDRGIAIQGFRPIVSLHNELHWRPWDRFVGDDLIQLIAFQGSLQQSIQELPDWHQRGLNSNHPWAVYASELADARVGNPPDYAGGVEVGLAWLWSSWRVTSGAGIYGGYQDRDYILEYPNHPVQQGEEGYNDGYGDLFAPAPEIHAELFRQMEVSARIIASGKGPETARLLGIVVPYSGQANVQDDRNGDGFHDVADTVF